MVKLDVHGVNLELTVALEDYMRRKIERAFTGQSPAARVHSVKANLSYESRNESHIVEIIVQLIGGKTLRNTTRSEDMYASIDIACSNIDRQLKKLKEKTIDVKRYRSMESKLNAAPDYIMPLAV